VLVADYVIPSTPRNPVGISLPEIRTATVEDALALAANLRPEVLAEALGVYDDVVGGIAWGIMDSAEAWVACVAGEPMAAWGVIDEGSLLVPVGRVWCLTTPLVDRHARLFARESRRIVGQWRRRWWRLHNAVDARYEVSVRWLEWMSFRVGPPWLNDKGVPFRTFEWQAP